MIIENTCKCKYCGTKIDYNFNIREAKAVTIDTWTVSGESKRAEDVFPYKNGYKVVVRCPKAMCNKQLFFEYDADGKYVGEL